MVMKVDITDFEQKRRVWEIDYGKADVGYY